MNARRLKPLINTLLAILIATPATGWASDSRSRTDPGARQSAPSFDPNASTEELLESAREMFIADKYDLAEMLYKSILIRESNNLSAMLELAIIYEATGQLQYARGLLTRALVIRPHDEAIIQRNTEITQKLARVLRSEIDSLLSVEAYEPAVPKLAVLLTTQPENADLYYKKAHCHLELGQPEAAIAEIDRALHLSREDRYYKLKAKVAASMQHDQVDALTRQAKRALLTESAQSGDTALRLISRILDLDPENGWAREQFLALTDNPVSGLERWDVSDRVSAWWSPVAQVLTRAGNRLLMLSQTLSGHLEILFTILLALLVFSSPLTHMLIRGFSPRQSLSGRLDHFSIPELLTLINTHHRTGVLILKTTSGKGRIYFDSGEIYHCKHRGAAGRETLQNLLKIASEGFFVFKDSVSSKEDTIDTPLSLILLELPARVDSITSQSILKKQKQQSKMKSLLGKGS